MATNRFDKPIQSEYISLYTPIPFELLYAIGKANNDRVDKLYLDLGDSFTKWSEFRSPSAVDTKRWYDLTIGQAQGLVNELTANPDLIKTAEGRSRIQSFINSRPYSELSNLLQSREGLLQRQKVNQQLMAQGKYNPLWHDVDFTNYNTSELGIYNDISPLAYKSEVDLVKPYVDNLKPGFIRQEGYYDWRGVSTDRTDAEIAKNISSIYNTPEAQMHIQTLVKQGYTPEQANALFADRIYRAGREFAYEDRDVNPLVKIDYANSSKRKYGDNTAQQRPMRLTESIAISGADAFRNGTLSYVTSKYRNQIEDLIDRRANNQISEEDYTNQMRNMQREASSYTPQKLFNDIFKQYATNGKLTRSELSNATNDILNRISVPIKNSKVNDILQETVPGVSSDKVDTPFGERRTITSGKDLDIATDIISEIAGYRPVQSGKDKVRNALKQGKLTNMILLQGSNVITLPSTKNGKSSPYSSQIITVAIPQSLLSVLGITDADMLLAGAKRMYNRDGKISFRTEVKENDVRKLPSQRYLTDDGYTDQYNMDGNVTMSQSSEDVYWQIDLLNKIPDPEDKINAEYLDQQAWKLSMSDTYRSELLSSTQLDAYGVGYSGGKEEE